MNIGLVVGAVGIVEMFVIMFAVFFTVIGFGGFLVRSKGEQVSCYQRGGGLRWFFLILCFGGVGIVLLFVLAFGAQVDRRVAPARVTELSSASRYLPAPVEESIVHSHEHVDLVSRVNPVDGALFARAKEPSSADSPNAWDENTPLVANVYPGIAECGPPLAAKLVKHLEKTIELKDKAPKAEAESPPKFRIALKNSSLDQPDFLNFLIEFRREFTESFPGSFVDDMTARSYPTPKDAEKEKQFRRLYVTVYDSSDGLGGLAKWDDRKSKRAKERSGQVVCKLRTNGSLGQVEFATDFIEKPWVADPEKFMSQNPKRKFIIGFSPRLATSEQDARVSAFDDANLRLLKSRQKQFRPNYDKERNVVDRFVQKLQMSGGPVWREAVLIDHGISGTEFHRSVGNTAASAPARVSSASDRRAKELSVVGRLFSQLFNQRLNLESAIAGLLLMTVVIGWVSNWMTQGYYRKPVWTVTGTVFSLGFIFLILIVVLNVA